MPDGMRIVIEDPTPRGYHHGPFGLVCERCYALISNTLPNTTCTNVHSAWHDRIEGIRPMTTDEIRDRVNRQSGYRGLPLGPKPQLNETCTGEYVSTGDRWTLMHGTACPLHHDVKGSS